VPLVHESVQGSAAPTPGVAIVDGSPIVPHEVLLYRLRARSSAADAGTVLHAVLHVE
jgi:hypothetical protein